MTSFLTGSLVRMNAVCVLFHVLISFTHIILMCSLQFSIECKDGLGVVREFKMGSQFWVVQSLIS